MSKKFIKFVLGLMSVLLTFVIFIVTRYKYSEINALILPVAFFFAIPIFMHYKYKVFKDKKFSKLYLILFITLYVISAILLIVIISSFYFSLNNILRLFNSFGVTLIFMILSWLILFFEFDDMDVECTDSEFYIGTLVYVTVILIHVNFCLNSNLVVKNNVNLIGENAVYLIQNYSYFSVMYIVVLINKIRKHW